jgi:hypothetical protein
MKNKGISVIVAVSIMLAAIVTVSATIQVFVIPELNRETAYTHIQEVFNNFNTLYYQDETTIPLSYSGTPFFSPSSFVGQLTFNPTETIQLTINGTKQFIQNETSLTDSANITDIVNISKAILNFQEITDNLEVNATFTKNPEEKLIFNLKSNPHDTSIRIQLNVTQELTSSYNYTLSDGDAFEIDFFAPIYNASSAIQNATSLYYTTNSQNCSLFIAYEQTVTIDLTYTANGSILYEPSNFPLSYLYTQYGLIALQGGTSSLPSSPQIFWTDDQLNLNLYNLTSNAGTISGTGNVKISYLTKNLTSLTSSFSTLKLKITSNHFDLTNSTSQLAQILRSSAPQGTKITFQQNNNWQEITIEGEKTLDLVIHNIEANIT